MAGAVRSLRGEARRAREARGVDHSHERRLQLRFDRQEAKGAESPQAAPDAAARRQAAGRAEVASGTDRIPGVPRRHRQRAAPLRRSDHEPAKRPPSGRPRFLRLRRERRSPDPTEDGDRAIRRGQAERARRGFRRTDRLATERAYGAARSVDPGRPRSSRQPEESRGAVQVAAAGALVRGSGVAHRKGVRLARRAPQGGGEGRRQRRGDPLRSIVPEAEGRAAEDRPSSRARRHHDRREEFWRCASPS